MEFGIIVSFFSFLYISCTITWNHAYIHEKSVLVHWPLKTLLLTSPAHGGILYKHSFHIYTPQRNMLSGLCTWMQALCILPQICRAGVVIYAKKLLASRHKRDEPGGLITRFSQNLKEISLFLKPESSLKVGMLIENRFRASSMLVPFMSPEF